MGPYTPLNVVRLSDIGVLVAEKTHASQHQHGGSDEVATSTPAANVIPKADASGKLPDGFVSESSVIQHEAALEVNWSQLVSVPSTFTPSAHSHDASAIDTGTLVHERGGLEANVSAYSGLLFISAGTTSAKTLSANGETLIGHTFSQMRTDLALSSTDAVQHLRLSTGSAPATITGFYNNAQTSGGTTQLGQNNSPRFGTDATNLGIALYSQPILASGSYTQSVTAGNYIDNPPALSGGAAITTLHGTIVKDQTRGTNNYGMTLEVSAGTNKRNLNITGTADNYLNGNVGIGTASFGSGAVRTAHLANGTRPTTFPTAGFVAESGEVSVWDTSGNFTLLSNHAVDRAIAAGIVIDFEADPLPDIYYSRNVYLGKEKFRYVDPTGTVQVQYVDIPEDEIRDWDEDQELIEAANRRAMAAWRADKEAYEHPDSRYEYLRKLAEIAHSQKRRLRDMELPNVNYEVPCPDGYVKKDPPQYMRGRLAKPQTKKAKLSE